MSEPSTPPWSPPPLARRVVSLTLALQAGAAAVGGMLGGIVAASYLFEKDHSGEFDGIQVPIGLGVLVFGIFCVTCLLLARAHLHRRGTLARTAVAVLELMVLMSLVRTGAAPLWVPLRITAVVALGGLAVDAVTEGLRR